MTLNEAGWRRRTPRLGLSIAPALRDGDHRGQVEERVDGDGDGQRVGAFVADAQQDREQAQRHDGVELRRVPAQVHRAEDRGRDADGQEAPTRRAHQPGLNHAAEEPSASDDFVLVSADREGYDAARK